MLPTTAGAVLQFLFRTELQDSPAVDRESCERVAARLFAQLALRIEARYRVEFEVACATSAIKFALEPDCASRMRLWGLSWRFRVEVRHVRWFECVLCRCACFYDLPTQQQNELD